MTRTYSDDTYGAHLTLNMGNKGSLDGTYQSAVDIVRHTWMNPVTVIDANFAWLTGGTNWGADTVLYLGKSTAGTGAVTAFCTATMGTDGTQADATVQDATCTETSFDAGDDIVFQAIGTIGLASIVNPIVEYKETFSQSDT